MGAVLTILFMAGTVVAVSFLRTPVYGSVDQLDIKKLIAGEFAPKSVQPMWLPSGDFLYTQTEDYGRLIMRYDIKTNNATLFLNTTSLTVDNLVYGSLFSDFYPSSDQSLVLFAINRAKQFRSSFYAQWILYDVHTGQSRYLLNGHTAANPTWNPSAQFADSLAIVVDNNVVLLSNLTTQEAQTNITTDGINLLVFNGMMDWLYEEEVFESSPALYWSPTGARLAFLKLNDTLVGEVPYPWFAPLSQTVYPTFKTVRYPKSGTTNPTASVHIYTVESGATSELQLLDDAEYVTNIAWIPTRTEQLSVRTLPRVQQVETIVNYNGVTGAKVDQIVSQNMTAYGWAESRPYSYIWVDQNRIVDIRVNNDWYHVALMNFADPNAKPVFLTSGNFSVMQIVGYDASKSHVYFISTEYSEISRLLYRVDLRGDRKYVTMPKANPARVFNVHWGPGTAYVLDGSSSASPPAQWVVSKHGNSPFADKLTDNAWILEKLSTYNTPTKTYTTAPGAFGDDLNVALIHPHEALKGVLYPVLFTYYNGPTSNRVTDAWSLAFNEWISTRSKMIVVTIDAAGTAGKSVSFNQQTFKRLGIRETEDQVAAIQHLLKKRLDMDWNRVACWGWSYGGFMTLSLAARSHNIFHGAVSVAPVTDWRLYDTFYTERYMLTPQMNEAGYNETSILNLVTKNSSRFDIGYQNKTHLYLVHGLADDNVHFQNSAEFVSAMIKQDAPLDMAYYPNQDHSISKDGSLLHLYHGIRHFLKQNVIDFLYYDLHPDS